MGILNFFSSNERQKLKKEEKKQTLSYEDQIKNLSSKGIPLAQIILKFSKIEDFPQDEILKKFTKNTTNDILTFTDDTQLTLENNRLKKLPPKSNISIEQKEKEKETQKKQILEVVDNVYQPSKKKDIQKQKPIQKTRFAMVRR